MKSGNKSLFAGILVVVLLLSFVGSVYAITGSIGNARMILRPEVGDTIDRTILVKNVNEVALNIELSASGDLSEEINIIDSEFQLAAGEERKARFTIKVEKLRATETKINVKFSPLDDGNGVGLSSTIIIIPEGDEGASGGFFGGLFGGNDEEEVVEGNQENGEVSVGQDKNDEVVEEANQADNSENPGSFGLMAIGGTFTIILFVVLLIALALASKHIKGKENSELSKKDLDNGEQLKSSVTKSSKKSKASDA